MELTSLVVKNEVFKQVEFKDIRCKVLDAKQIYNLTKLLKRKHNQVQEIEKYRCQLVMNGWSSGRSSCIRHILPCDRLSKSQVAEEFGIYQ